MFCFHTDLVTGNLDGTITIVEKLFLNPAYGTSMNGATISGTAVHNGGGTVTVTTTITPGAPIVQQVIKTNGGRSSSG
jgi:hypothetical protein